MHPRPSSARLPIFSSLAHMNDGGVSQMELIPAEAEGIMKSCIELAGRVLSSYVNTMRVESPRIRRGYEKDPVFAVKGRSTHLIVLALCLVEIRSLGGTHGIPVRGFSVLATSISRQTSTPPSAEIYCQRDSIGSSLFSSHTPLNVRSLLLEYVLATSPSEDKKVEASGGHPYKALIPCAVYTYSMSPQDACFVWMALRTVFVPDDDYLQVYEATPMGRLYKETHDTILASWGRHSKPVCRRPTIQSSSSTSVSSIIAGSIHGVTRSPSVRREICEDDTFLQIIPRTAEFVVGAGDERVLDVGHERFFDKSTTRFSSWKVDSISMLKAKKVLPNSRFRFRKSVYPGVFPVLPSELTKCVINHLAHYRTRLFSRTTISHPPQPNSSRQFFPLLLSVGGLVKSSRSQAECGFRDDKDERNFMMMNDLINELLWKTAHNKRWAAHPALPAIPTSLPNLTSLEIRALCRRIPSHVHQCAPSFSASDNISPPGIRALRQPSRARKSAIGVIKAPPYLVVVVGQMTEPLEIGRDYGGKNENPSRDSLVVDNCVLLVDRKYTLTDAQSRSGMLSAYCSPRLMLGWFGALGREENIEDQVYDADSGVSWFSPTYFWTRNHGARLSMTGWADGSV
ncbi:hypothetical protein EDD85DRAFT_783015 [Armillaria nabsnona]|nr:hypothetical protein EDD85DRAFT_783015 [Armillaria nabsnona]